MRFKSVVLLLLLWMAQAQAMQLVELYQVDEPVPAGGKDSRQELLGRAFDSQIWRLTGLEKLDKYPVLQQLREDPQEVIRGYSNRNTLLRVRFDPASLLGVLQQQELAIWGEQRPVLLLWWTQKDLHGQHLYNDAQRMAQLIVQRADYRGLPVRFPLADLQEQILTESLNLLDSAQVNELLQRYSADMLLRVSVDDAASPQARWQLYEQGHLRQGSIKAQTVPELADGVFKDLGRYFINKYAVVQGQGEALNIQVSGLSFNRLMVVEQLLQPFAAKLLKLDGDYGVWQVRAMPEQLRALFELQQIQQLPAPQQQVYQPEPQPESQLELEPEQADAGLSESEPEPELAAPLHIDLYFQ